MRLSNFTFLLWASLCLLCSGIGCSNSSTYEPLWNPPQQTDPEEPEEPDDVSFVVYNHLADSPDVNVSTVWEVTLSQNGVEKECMVFQSTCPVYDPSKGMIGSDRTALELVAGRTISWANFSFDGEVTVTARILDPSRVPMSSSVAVYPSRKHVSPSLGPVRDLHPDRTRTILGGGRRGGLSERIDDLRQPARKGCPESDDAAYRRVENATAADMAALPADRSGIYFARGVHDIGKYIVPAHVKNIYIPGDAYVYGTLVVENNPGVRIFGRGTLSAARLPYRASHSIEATGDSNGMVVEGITIADFTHFSVRLITTNNRVEWVKTIGAWTYNCDGISVFHYSTVKNCFIWANDDSIKVYRDGITFEDIVCWQLTNGNIIRWHGTTPTRRT